ncbi:MAG: hypothetical protein F4Y00_06995 [Bacteroidetes bacterium SB0662_bin_6]|nr:hypothetical protein [Bacteroidetes bacterium SB0668_bin_1]MYE04699.1 hypothetical protein [Bacteroidetes bacterium SB0662_bin_6]
MDRRHFITCAAAGALALGLPGAAWQTGPSANLQTLARPALLDMLGERRVRDLGMHYREVYPAECDVDILRAAILGSDMPALTDARTLHSHLEATIRSDFAAGRTVLLKGWVLSVTEARQCALFSLVYS